MLVSFAKISNGREYSRKVLAHLWGYSSYHALARGVVTPQGDNKIVLFVTEKKQDSLTQYVDRLEGKLLHWEGPNDHFAESRMSSASRSGDEIHLFYRVRHHLDFTYMGLVTIAGHVKHAHRPSEFSLRLI
jgi:hypothetical protein